MSYANHQRWSLYMEDSESDFWIMIMCLSVQVSELYVSFSLHSHYLESCQFSLSSYLWQTKRTKKAGIVGKYGK